MLLRERLERLEALLADLRDANKTTPILVEGARDRKALQELGCQGTIQLVHDGRRLIETADQLAHDHEEVILLLDWDRTGGAIHHRVLDVLETHAVDCEVDFRRDLAHLVTKETRDVEDLPDVLRHFRTKAGPL